MATVDFYSALRGHQDSDRIGHTIIEIRIDFKIDLGTMFPNFLISLWMMFNE